jgi:hypothetical protein
MYVNRIGGVMVSALVSSTVCLGFESHSALPITINGYVCFSAKHAALRSKSKDWLVRNQDNVSKWRDMPTRKANTI